MKKSRLIYFLIMAGIACFTWYQNKQQASNELTSSEKTEQDAGGYDKSKVDEVFGGKSHNSNATQEKPFSGKSKSVKTNVPDYVWDVLEYVTRTGKAKKGYVGGRKFMNREKRLPKNAEDGKRLNYREWDVHPKRKGKNRGAERLVTGSNGSAFYTKDHYKTFKKIKINNE